MSTNIMKYVVPKWTMKPRLMKRPFRSRRKRYVVRKRRNGPYTKISKMPVPQRYFTTLRYSENVSFAVSASNTLYNYVFRSGIYDPDVTGTGHQPLYRDQLAALYNKYRVYGIKYYIAIKSGTAIELTTFYVKHNSDSTTDTSLYTLRERAEGKALVLNAANGAVNKTRGYMSVPKTFGISKKEFIADDDFVSSIGADPAKTAYLQLYSHTVGGATTIYAAVDLVYYVEFFDRIDVASS